MSLALVAATALALGAGDELLARVDDVAITKADALERRRAMRGYGAPPTAAQLVEQLVDDALLAKEAARLGLAGSASVRAQVERQRRRMVVEAFVEKELAPLAEPSDEELVAAFKSSGDAVRLTLVKVGSEAEAKAVLARVQAGGSLADEAKRGLDPSLAQKAGDTGLVTRPLLDPALADKAFAARPGTLLGPIELQLGWAIARVEAQVQADLSAFPARRDALRSFLRTQRLGTAKAHYLKQLRAKGKVAVDEGVVRALDPAKAVSPEQASRVIATLPDGPLKVADVLPALVDLAAASRGHGAGPVARLATVEAEVDQRLLFGEAARRGLDRDPAILSALPSIERNIQASAAAGRIGAGAPDAAAAVSKRISELRRSAAVSVDAAAVARLEGELK